MRIEGWSVDAFGHLHDHELDGLTGGVNVLVGPNEWGKTTLLHFLRWVLFGFPRPQTKIFQHYRPESGRYGGRIQLGVGDRTVIVERHSSDDGPTLTGTDGGPVTDLTWSDIVGTARLELFESVFAVTVDELQGFGELSSDEVREHVYAAAVVGAGRSAREALNELDGDRRALLGPRSGAIRATVRHLKDGQGELEEAQRQARSLPTKRAEVDELLRQVEARRARREEVEAEHRRGERLLELWPTWSGALGLRRELDEMRPPVDLPSDPVGALERAIEETQTTASECREAEQAVAATRQLIDAVEVDDAIAEVAAEVHLMAQRQAAQAERRNRLHQQRLERRQQNERLDDRLRELGPGWTGERVAAVDVSMDAVEGIRQAAEAVREAESGVESAGLARGAKEVIAAERREALTDLRAELAAVREPLDALGDRRAAHDAAQRLQVLLPQLVAVRQTSADRERLDRLLTRVGDRAGATAVPAWLAPVAFGAAVLAALGAVVGFATGGEVPGGALVLVGIVLVLVGGVLVRARTRAEADARREADERSAQQGRSGGAGLDPASMAAQVRAAAMTAGFGTEPQLEAVQRLLDLFRRERGLVEEEAKLTRSSERADTALQAAVETEATARKALHDATGAWSARLARHGLPEDLAPSSATTFVQLLRGARDDLRAVAGLDEQSAETKAAVDRHDDAVRALVARVGDEVSDDLDRTLTALAERVTRDDEARRSRARLEEQLATQLAAATDLGEMADAAADQLQILLADAGAATIDEYREVASTEARRAELERGVTKAEDELRGAFGRGPTADEARSELDRGAVPEWEAELTMLTERRAAVTTEHEEAVRAHQVATTALEELEASADVARLSLEVESLRSELTVALDGWAVSSVAHRAIDDTLRRFERERQPGVVKRAAAAFRRITDDSYVGLVPDDDSLHLLLPNDARLDADRLSRGATEQLYLALRFGLALEYATTTPLPLVLDDVLVNADPDRRTALAEELVRVGEEIQVLLFTCHPDTAVLLEETDPTATVEVLRA